MRKAEKKEENIDLSELMDRTKESELDFATKMLWELTQDASQLALDKEDVDKTKKKRAKEVPSR